MAGRSRPFEFYALRAFGLAFAGWAFWCAADFGSPMLAGFGAVGLLLAFRGRDFKSVARWWVSLGLYLVLLVWLVASYLRLGIDREPFSKYWSMYLVLGGCLLAHVGVLLSGRIRGVWAFTRRSPEPESD